MRTFQKEITGKWGKKDYFTISISLNETLLYYTVSKQMGVSFQEAGALQKGVK